MFLTQKEAAMTTSRHNPFEKNRTPVLPSPEELMEQYAALIWKICSHYLNNPEDIKECVNDTFLAFYMQSETFNPEKGDALSLLAVIARNKAVSRARKNRSYTGQPETLGSSGKSGEPAASGSRFVSLDIENIPDQNDEEEQLIQRADLEAAMRSLSPDEFDLIRMKYYDGMTIREIAESINIPYETVKKRHQRTLDKLRRYLTMALIIIVIAAVLSACAYIILRYFKILPGYGVIRTDDDSVFYVLDEEVTVEKGQYEITLSNAFLYDGILSAEFIIHSAEPVEAYTDGFPWYSDLSRYWSVSDGTENFPFTVTDDGYSLDETTQQTSCSGSFSEDSLRDELSLVNETAGLTIPFRLISFQALPADCYSYETGEFGGFAVDAYMEDGHLMADIYSLSKGEFSIFPAGAMSSIDDSVQAESAEGDILEGTFIKSISSSDSALSSSTLQTFDFGPAAPGDYTIRIDTPTLRTPLPDDLRIPLSELHSPEGTHSFPVPEGTLEFGTPLSEDPFQESKSESEPVYEGSITFIVSGDAAVSAPLSDLPLSEVTEENPSEIITVAEPPTQFYYPIEVIPDRDDLIYDQIVFNMQQIDSNGNFHDFMSTFVTVFDPEDFSIWGDSFSWQGDPGSDIETLYLSGAPDEMGFETYISYGWDYVFEIPVTAGE